MQEEPTYTIGQLAARLGITPRTIRYYVAEGLLPPPDTRGRYAHYGVSHLRRLQLIAHLKEAYLPLAEIKARLAPLSDAAVQELLATIGTPSRSQFHTNTAPEHPSARVPTSQPALPPSMPARLPGQSSPTGRPPEVVPPVAAADQFNPPGVPLHHGYAASWTTPESEADVPGLDTAERWQRLTLAPGVELHVRLLDSPELQERLRQLVAYAQDLFRDARES